MNIYIASDHAGFDLKKELLIYLKTVFFQQSELEKIITVDIFDLGPFDLASVDYPDYADQVCRQLINTTDDFGILICGSGQGMALRTNKHPHIRAALVYNEEICKLSREHNNANVICLGSRFCTLEDSKNWISVFLNTKFSEGRHALRVAKISSAIILGE